MISIIKLYENNILSLNNIIKNIQNFFENNTLSEYYNNKSNILLVSSIINNQSDIDFIYNNLLNKFYNNSNNYILGYPCFKVTMDGNDKKIFHENCDRYENTIIFIKTNKTRFGGITDIPWVEKFVHKDKLYNNTKTKLFNLDTQNIFDFDNNYIFNDIFLAICPGDFFHSWCIFGSNDIILGLLPWESSSCFPKRFFQKNNNSNEENFNEL